jgi:hypothetical protein
MVGGSPSKGHHPRSSHLQAQSGSAETRRKGIGEGVVAWDVQVTNQLDELVASYAILTLVAKQG